MQRSIRTLVLTTAIALFSCSGSGGNDVSCTQEYWDGTYGTCLPKGWILVDSETLRQRQVPEETLIAFQANDAVSGMFPTVVLTREALSDPLEPDVYSAAAVRSVTTYPDYDEVETRSVTVDGATVKLHIYTARLQDGAPTQRFYQLSTVHEGFGYSVTGTTPVTVDSTLEQQVELVMLQSTFVDPATKSE